MNTNGKTVAELVEYWGSHSVDWEAYRRFYIGPDEPSQRHGQYVCWSNVLDNEGYPGCFAVCDDFGSLVPLIPADQVGYILH